MLSSITPFGERGRHNRFAVTATFFVAGAIAGGVVLGALAGLLGMVVLPDQPAWILAIVAVLALVGALVDAGVAGVRVPTITRQVDENWLHKYRGWVYGVGFGAQLGFGLATIVSSAAVYVMIAAAIATRSLAAGMLIGGLFGALRGTSILLVRRVRNAPELRSLHRRLAANATTSERASVVAQAAMTLAGVLAIVGLR
jgi:hypothetical protein